MMNEGLEEDYMMNLVLTYYSDLKFGRGGRLIGR